MSFHEGKRYHMAAGWIILIAGMAYVGLMMYALGMVINAAGYAAARWVLG